tara:strand:+ start:4289 stop:4729 length:441 start_codon:yes stop_codon:yes gene_type:complete
MPQNKTYLANIDKSKLDKLKRVKLAEAKKIELSLVGDAKVIVKEAQAIDKKLIAALKPYQKLVTNYEKVYAQVLDFLDSTKGMTQEGEELQKKANDIYDKLEKGANDLGTNVTDIPVANQLDEVAIDLEDSIQDVKNARSETENIA